MHVIGLFDFFSLLLEIKYVNLAVHRYKELVIEMCIQQNIILAVLNGRVTMNLGDFVDYNNHR